MSSIHYQRPPALLSRSQLDGGLGPSRVPNFPSDYLAALNNAGGCSVEHHQHQQPQHQPPSSTTGGAVTSGGGGGGGGGGGAAESPTPRSADSDSSSASAALTAADPFACGASSASAATTMATTVSAPPSYPQVAMTATTNEGGNNNNNEPTRPQQQHQQQHNGDHIHHDNTRHSLPSSIVLSASQLGGMGGSGASDFPPSHPVPEFLCHLYSMVSDPAISDLISWAVPSRDETNDQGGGRAGVGKVVVSDPTRLQDEVLGKYYRHSKYSSFQRQLNYFGFKKRLHGSRKGKMCPCSFVHNGLGLEPQSLLRLKRRPPSGRRALEKEEATRGKAPHRKRPPSKDGPGGIPHDISLPVLHGVVAGVEAPKATASSLTLSTAASSACGTAQSSLGTKNEHWCGTAANSHQAAIRTAAPGGPLDMPVILPPGATPWPAPSNSLTPGFRKNVSAPEIRKKFAAIHALELNFLKCCQSERPAASDAVPLASAPAATVRQPMRVETVAAVHPTMTLNRPQKPLFVTGMPNGESGFSLPSAQASASTPGGSLPPAQVSVSTPGGSLPPTFHQMPLPMANGWMGQLPTRPTLATNPPTLFADFAKLAQANNFLVNFNIGSSAVHNASNLHTNNMVSGEQKINNNNIYNNSNGPIMTSAATIGQSGQAGVISETPPVEFNDMLSNLLSTALPPSEELFDDDMSAGNISDFGEGALQVADDGMLLP